MNTNKNISVVMNSYNEKYEFFLQAILSYLNQKEVNVELIVSTVKNDPCIEICKKYSIKLVISETPGIWHQLNAGMKTATGDWITYASSNDVALEDKLIKEVNKCIEFKKEVCYSSFHRCDENLVIRNTAKFENYNYEKHLNGNYVSDCALFSKRLLENYSPFKEEFANFAFYDFWLRIYEGEGNVFIYNDSPTWLYRIYKDSRHIVKQKNPELLKLEKIQRENMLKSHNKII